MQNSDGDVGRIFEFTDFACFGVHSVKRGKIMVAAVRLGHNVAVGDFFYTEIAALGVSCLCEGLSFIKKDIEVGILTDILFECTNAVHGAFFKTRVGDARGEHHTFAVICFVCYIRAVALVKADGFTDGVCALSEINRSAAAELLGLFFRRGESGKRGADIALGIVATVRRNIYLFFFARKCRQRHARDARHESHNVKHFHSPVLRQNPLQ